MKNDRLFSILYLLLNRRQTTAGALAEKFEVSVRTVYRDIDTLCRSGIPIYTERGKNGGIFLMDNCVLDKASFAKQEQEELITAVESTEALQPELHGNLSKKLRAFFDTQEKQKITIDFTSWNPADKTHFIQIRQAVLARKMISFTYHNSSGITSRRNVAPLQLYFKSAAWYLIGHCMKSNAIRIFKLKRMTDLTISETTISEKLSFSPMQKTATPVPTTVVKMKISSLLAYRVYDEFTPEEYTREEDGSFLLHYQAPENDWLYGYLLSFHPHAEVLAPLHIRQKLQSLLTESIKKYTKIL